MANKHEVMLALLDGLIKTYPNMVSIEQLSSDASDVLKIMKCGENK